MEYVDTIIQLENEHLFGNKSLSSNADIENEESIEKALLLSQQFGDGFCNITECDVFDEEYCNFLYSNNQQTENNPNIETQIKSWLINWETKETKLIISDIEDEKIPEILKYYDWLLILEIDCQKIKKIENLPKNIKELSLFNNQIENIPNNELPKSLEILNLSRNKIRVLENIPKNIKGLDISHNLIKKCIIKENINLMELCIEHNLLETFPELPDSIIKLDISQNLLTEIKDIQDSIEDIDFSSNNITGAIGLPKNLKRLNGYNNKIRLVIKYPESIEYIDLSQNEFFWVSKLPDSVVKADFSMNKINTIALHDENNILDNINGKLLGNYTINLSFNPLKYLPVHILENPRIIHNIPIIESELCIPVKEYYKITHLKNLVL